MKIKLFFLALFSIAIHTMVIAKPLTIINPTTSPMAVKIFIQSSEKPIEVRIDPSGKYVYEMNNHIFERMIWSTYGKKENINEFLLKTYFINVQDKLPTMMNGGTVVLSLGGEYVADDKSGKRRAVKFGSGDKFNNSTNTGQSNEE